MTLSKEERLRGKRVISNLFDHGNHFFYLPYKIFWQNTYPLPSPNENAESDVLIRFAVSVSKRRFKSAVKRNLIKRRTREVFRTNKQILNDTVTGGRQIHLIMIYICEKILPYADLETSMRKILQRIAKQHVESV